MKIGLEMQVTFKNSGHKEQVLLLSEFEPVLYMTNYLDIKTDLSCVPLYCLKCVVKNNAQVISCIGWVDTLKLLAYVCGKGKLELNPIHFFQYDSDDSMAQDFSKDENEERGNWSGRLDFLLACLGYAVGKTDTLLVCSCSS